MSEPTIDQQNEGSETERRNWRRELEDRAQAGDEAVKKLAAMERREAARDAGLDPKNPLVAMFLKSYEGEVTADAIKEAASEVGLTSAVSAPQGQQTTDQPNPAQQQIDAITQAAGSPAAQGTDYTAELEKAYESGGVEALLDQAEKYGVPITTRQ
jgi:hypothetical protein